MDTSVAVTVTRMLPQRLQSLQRLSGLPVVFGGSTRPEAPGAPLVISRLAGTIGRGLQGLTVRPGQGLGGLVLQQAAGLLINDYAGHDGISHHYDRVVVQDEAITSVFAVPVLVAGSVAGVLYGAVRDRQPIGGRAVQQAIVIARQLERDATAIAPGPPDRAGPRTGADALARLGDIAQDATDPALRERLTRVHQDLLRASPTPPPLERPLSPREVDVLRSAAAGDTTIDTAAALGLSVETVKAYLSTAMRKLGARNRAAAVHQCHVHGLI